MSVKVERDEFRSYRKFYTHRENAIESMNENGNVKHVHQDKYLVRFNSPDALNFFPDTDVYNNAANRSFFYACMCRPNAPRTSP
jgi:hypothetical protein